MQKYILGKNRVEVSTIKLSFMATRFTFPEIQQS
jgi:hypothetical protein